jgi:ribosomal protein S18 acetylase RimI-like enzyme
MKENIQVQAVTSNNIFDRIRLCWGHLEDWQHLEIVERSKEWLEKTNRSFTPTTFIAYVNDAPAGMIEFIPQKLMKKIGLCPCRVDPERRNIKSRYILGKEFEDFLFISCLWVDKEHQGKGVGKTLLKHFLNSSMFKNSDGALVYVSKRDERWDKHIHWPSGPKEFYLKAGFRVEKTLDKPVGYLLCYRNSARGDSRHMNIC